MPQDEILVRFYFARLNLIFSRPNFTKEEFILSTLQSDRTVDSNNFKWGFCDVSSMNNDGELYFTGMLVKYEPEGKEETIDEKKMSVSKTEVLNKVKGKSAFILHPHSGILAYHESGSHIKLNQFRIMFAKLFESINDNLFVNAEVQAIVGDSFKIEEVFHGFDRIDSIYIYLHPTNPGNRQAYELTDEKLKKLGAESYVQEYKVKDSEKSLKVAPDSPVVGDIIMASDGFGDARIHGSKDGHEKIVRIQKMSKSERAPKDNTDSMFNALKDSFKHLLSMVRRNDKT